MELSLDTYEQTDLAEAIRVMASPLEHEQPQDWVREVVARARKVLGGENKGILEVPPELEELFFHPGFSEKDIAEYHEYRPLLTSTDLFERTARLGVATRRDAYGPHHQAVMQGPLGQDYLPRVKAYDALILTTSLHPRPSKQHDVIQLIFNSTRPNRPFTDKQVEQARLLYPAFRAGVATYRRLASVRERLGALLDASGGACALLSPDGVLLHYTPTLETALAREPRREALMTLVRQVAVSFGSGNAETVHRAASETCYTGVCGPYVLTPTYVHELTRLPSILVTVTPPPSRPTLPHAEAVQSRHGLTPQQARVALLLAERRTNQEIADALSISVHTARHHVAHTLEKLDVPRRKVRATIMQP